MQDILTPIDTYGNVSTLIDGKGGTAMAVDDDPFCCPPGCC
ncbi:MAG: hypothetical protein ACRDH7_01635 [Actinomycetota bacterium]